MDPTESRTKKRRKIAHANVDRISEMSDNLLILILSSLSTKEAVQTSLLAKRNLWAAVPVLDFDFDEFCLDDYTIENLEEYEEKICEYEEKFTNFVDGVFERRDPSIHLDSFKLKWNEAESSPDRAPAWLDTVAKSKPKCLSVHIYTENYYFEVPDSIFSCESLQEMELQLGFEAISPSSVNLPCLKKLTLNTIDIADEVMQKLSALPALEEMVLSNCHLYTCDISSGTLKRLVLDGCHNEIEPAITISTPSLLYLEVLSWTMGTIKFKKLESLLQACIHCDKFDDEDPLFFTGLSNATYLELMLPKSGVMQMKDVLEEGTTKFSTFNNLKTLKIGEWCMTCEFDVVACFLFHARNLEKLTLLHCQERNKESLSNLINLLERPRKIWTVDFRLDGLYPP
ncbi:F-box protein At4g22280-like isoform X1 [Carex rostrata]